MPMDLVPGQPRPEKAIGNLDARSRVVALIHGELVTQCEDLELQGDSRSEACTERGNEGEEDCLHEGSKLPHLSGTRHESLACPCPAKLP
jgi:hypothetical protein